MRTCLKRETVWSYHAPLKLGFSLVELSIVLVILGLLVGGILAGQSLIRAAELRSITADYQRYQAAIYSFRDKYFALPGDITNATSFWPSSANGNGDAILANNTENYRLWEHLALAGLIEGSYTGYVSPANYSTTPVIGRDVPAGKLSSSYWTSGYLSQSSAVNFEVGYTDLPDIRYNWLFFTGRDPTYGWIAYTGTYIMKPEEAWNVDSKIDDGKPASGKVRSSAISTTCTTTTTSAADYNLSGASMTCRILGFLLN
ncbi:MAG: type II secretion system protein [Rickettsiales bacterium]